MKQGSYVHLAPTHDTLIHPSSCRWGAGWWIGHSSKKNRNDRTAVHNGYESSSPTKYTVSLVLSKTPGPRVFALFQIIQVIEENCNFHTKERIIACIYNLRIIQLPAFSFFRPISNVVKCPRPTRILSLQRYHCSLLE